MAGKNEGAAGFSRQDIQAAFLEAAELRALHAALMQGNSPSKLKFASASPVSCRAPLLSPHDYPVFTPSYEDEPLAGYQQDLLENRSYTEGWGEHTLNVGNVDGGVLSEHRWTNPLTRKGLLPRLTNMEDHRCLTEDQNSVTGSCAYTIAESGPDQSKYMRSTLGDLTSVASYNRCKPASINNEQDGFDNGRKPKTVVSYIDSQSSVQSLPRNRGMKFSWLFPRLTKKPKNDRSPLRLSQEVASHSFNDSGMASVEALKKELVEANQSRDEALIAVADMQSSIGDLSRKLEYLEAYCEELKKSLREAVAVKNSHPEGGHANLLNRGKSIGANAENIMPVSEEVMVEGFLQIVSEARLSVKQFCKVLVGEVVETDLALVDNLNTLLHPYKLSLNSKCSKSVLYHMEAVINQSIYQDFENSVFQTNGALKILDPQQGRHAHFQSFVALRNLSWNEVLRKGTKYYSSEFCKFCDDKMSSIITMLGWTKPWPEELLQAFFVAAKCIWLLHLLAFSFNPPLGILRVIENMPFEPGYMEDIFADRHKSQGHSRVKVMVMPGFYVHARVLRCKVICRYKSGA